MEPMDGAERSGTTLNLAALNGRRSEVTAALKQLEHALLTDGWCTIVDDRLVEPTNNLYAAAEPLFKDADVCALHKRDALPGEHLGLTFLGDGEEPLYDEGAKSQFVRSFNMHEEVDGATCDARLGGNPDYDAEERALAHGFHSWLPSDQTTKLRLAASDLRKTLHTVACEPLLKAFALLLGHDESYLASRCSMTTSDNTSLLRCLEYPQEDAAAGGHEDEAVWGVSCHTDFELFSLLHEQSAGLRLCDPEGVWHAPSSSSSSSWVLIVGDMLSRLSSGYLHATPHRVIATRADAAIPRRSIVFFQALDENVALAPVKREAARRAPTGRFRRWWDETGGRAVEDAALTQREWTELKEAAANERRLKRERDG